MNSFTDQQRQVIRDLAEFYWDKMLGPVAAGIPEEHKRKMRDSYVVSILTGLQFDDYWDRHGFDR